MVIIFCVLSESFIYLCSYIVTMTSLIKMELRGYEAVEKIAHAGGNSARIYVPKHWQGKKVKAVLLEP